MIRLKRATGVERLTLEEFEELVLRGALPPETPVCYPAVTGDRFVPADSLELVRGLRHGRQDRFRRPFTLRRPAWITLAFALLCGVVYWFSVRGGDPLSWGAKSQAHVWELGQWWRLLTACVLHADIAHLVLNLVYTVYLGWNVEAAYGHAPTGLLLLLSGIGSMGLSLLFVTAPTVGASGITFGLFAAAIVFGWRYGDQLPRPVKGRFGFAMFPFLLFFLLMGMRNPGVDNMAHLGGMLAGGLGAFIVRPSIVDAERVRGSRVLVRLGVAAQLVVLVLVGGPLLAGPLSPIPLPPLSQSVEDEVGGYQLAVPGYWLPGRDFLGWQGFRSPTGQMRVSHGVYKHWLPLRPEDVAPALVRDIHEATGGWLVYAHTLESEVLEDGRVAASAVVASPQGPTLVRRVSELRGCYEYQLHFAWPVDSAALHRRLEERIVRGWTVQEPRSLVRRREAAELLPERWRPQTDLAREAIWFGALEEAAGVFEGLPDDGADELEPRYWQLYLGLYYGRSEPEALWPEIEALLADWPRSLKLRLLALDAATWSGREERARTLLEEMMEREGLTDRVLSRARALQMAVPEPELALPPGEGG